MAGKISAAMERALKLVTVKGMLLSHAAEREGVDVRSLRRAMRRSGEEPRAPGGPRGPRSSQVARP